MKNSFKIENTVVNYKPEALDADQFTIQSIPFKYSVSFVSETQLKDELKRISQANKEKHFVFIDEMVASYHGKTIFKDHRQYPIVAKETNKTMSMMTRLIAELQKRNFTKKEIFLSAGGGITQDVSSFTRAVYKRGIPWTYIPTTLLAMADSCIGAKACLNHNRVKNILGLFSAPLDVFIYGGFLKTLSHRDILSGYGEIMKLAIIGGQSSIGAFKKIQEKQAGDYSKDIEQMIKLGLLVKKSVIEIDEYENNIRKALNYGHTIGHALEPLVAYKIPHGIAISIGMVIENMIAVKYGTLTSEEASELNHLILPFIDPASLNLLRKLTAKKVIENMKRDKKTLNNDIYMAVPKRIGHFDLLKVTSDKRFEKELQSLLNHTAGQNRQE